MAIFRVQKTENFTVIDNGYLKDERLSLKTKGLFTIILSLPDDWNFSIRGLAATVHEKECTIDVALKELKSTGYIKVVKVPPSKETGQRFTYRYDVFERPQEVISLGVETLGVEALGLEKQPLYKYTNQSNTKEIKKRIHQLPPKPPLEEIELQEEQIKAIQQFYNANRGNMPECSLLSPKRKSLIAARLADSGEETVQRVITLAATNNFLQGNVSLKDGNTFLASIDWLMNQNNFAKVIGGAYAQHQAPPKSLIDKQFDEIFGG